MSYKDKMDELNNQINDISEILKTSNIPEVTWWSTTNAMTISLCILIFGLFVIWLATNLLHEGKSADNVLKTLGTLLIIIAALFLVVAGYSNEQIAPVIGLLGTIAGYLLGKGNNENKPQQVASME